ERLRERPEERATHPLTHVERPTMADDGRHVNEAVVRVAVRDAVVLDALGTHAQAPDREYAAFERGCVQRIEQLIEVEPAVQIRRILDDQMRQDDGSGLLIDGGRTMGLTW